MIKQTQENLQQALNIPEGELETLMHNITVLTDNGYYTDKTVYQNYDEEHYNLIIPNKKQASHQNDCLRRKKSEKTEQ